MDIYTNWERVETSSQRQIQDAANRTRTTRAPRLSFKPSGLVWDCDAEIQFANMKLEAIPGAEVTVCVNHEALQEYNDNDDRRSNNVVGVKYIEAKSDSNFSVSVTADTNHRGSRDEHDVLCCFLHLDGKFVSGTVLRDRGGFDRGKVSAKFVGKYNDGQHTLERFKFADLETSKLIYAYCIYL